MVAVSGTSAPARSGLLPVHVTASGCFEFMNHWMQSTMCAAWPDQQPAGVVPEVIPVEKAQRVHRTVGRGTQPLLPIQIAGEFTVAQRSLVVVPRGGDQPDVAEPAAVHDLFACQEHLGAAPLRSHLNDAARPLAPPR